MYHCGGGPAAATLDMLTPLTAWVEDGHQPAQQVVSYHSGADASAPVSRARPVAPYPVTMVYSGSGDINSAASFVVGPPTNGVSDTLVWAGSKHYRPGEQVSCSQDGLRMRCR
jgi:Tannase and feruloyl esterase